MTELATTEAQALADHEAVIRRGLNTFVEVGTALMAIRDDRLYRADFATFEDYCRERWGLTRSRAYQLIESAEAVSTIVDTGLPAPENEAQARQLARVPEEHREDVWRETVERTNGKPTAAAVRETYRPEPVDDEDDYPPPERTRQPPEPTTNQKPDDAELFASLDEHMEETAARFRLNFGRAMKALFTVLSFDRDRIIDTSDHAMLQGELDLLTEWADDLRRRLKPSLRVVGGDHK